MTSASLTLFEFESVFCQDAAELAAHQVPKLVFDWLVESCLKTSQEGAQAWLKLGQRKVKRCVQVTNFVGVIRAPNGYQIEVLPKVGKVGQSENVRQARTLLIDMLRCLYRFRHIQTDSAHLSATRMPLLEVFIREFLLAVQLVVKRGMRSDYVSREDNLFALRGKLLVAEHLRHNLIRADRFFTSHDQFIPDRPENRLIHSALRQVVTMCQSPENQRIARELAFVFSDIPLSSNVRLDIQRIRLDRGMNYYEPALDWTKLLLESHSPVSSQGEHEAPSLLFPMESLFEAYVAKHLAKQLSAQSFLKTQASSQHLVTHEDQLWFRLKPDLLVMHQKTTRLVLDTKWKLLDSAKKNGREKYQLSQADFYQLYAYGHHYLGGTGDMVLIYPKTESFTGPLPVFDFPKAKEEGMRLWVVPFCLKARRLELPSALQTHAVFAV